MMKKIVRKMFPLTIDKVKRMSFDHAQHELYECPDFIYENLSKRDRHIVRDIVNQKPNLQSDSEFYGLLLAYGYRQKPKDKFLETLVLAFSVCLMENSFQRFVTVLFMLSINRATTTEKDLIRMGWEKKKPYDFFWSDSKKRERHDEYAREETYERLKKENEVYNLRKYKSKLPESSHQYLIKDSASLAIEGMKQKHCVASYNSRVKRGDCVIASVHLDGKDWTVEIEESYLYGGLKIDQIKGRFNKDADPETTKKIYQIFEIEQPAGMTEGALFHYSNTRQLALQAEIARLRGLVDEQNLPQLPNNEE